MTNKSIYLFISRSQLLELCVFVCLFSDNAIKGEGKIETENVKQKRCVCEISCNRTDVM